MRVFYLIVLFILVGLDCICAQVDTVYQEVNPFEGQKLGFSLVDSWPQYPGGAVGIAKFVASNTKYPQEALNDSVQGTVIVSYLIQVDGSIGDVKVVKSVHPALDAEAVRVIRLMEQWKPAIQKGKPVKLMMNQQFNFRQ
ncbi:MAG: energy transducer TonB [Sphingobacteriaceae bacterium]|nr:energy transducer TonB [Sphingobacteriaceae bacterium]